MSAIDTIPSLKQWRAEQSQLHVVLLSPEADTAHILRASDSSRFRITHVSEVDDVLAISPPPDVLLFPTMMGENRLLKLHRTLHRQGCAFLLAGSIRYASPEISRIGRAVIGWPIHLLELTDALDRIQHDAQRTTLRLSRENLRRLALLWSRAETGRLQFRNVRGTDGGEIALVEGAVDPADWPALYPLLHSGRVRFKRSRSITPSGHDRSWTGQVLLSAAWSRGATGFAQRCGDGVLAPLSFALDLPITPQARRLLSAADGTTPLEQLLLTVGVKAPAVGEDLYALSWLELLTWQRRPARLRRTERSPTSRTGRSLYSQTSTSGARPRSRRLERPEAVRVWLQKTITDLPRATPQSVLGVTADVSDEMLGIAERRLLDRYDTILRAVNVPEDIAKMARQLRRITERAAERMRQRLVERAEDSALLSGG